MKEKNCDCNIIHADVVRRVERALPNEQNLYELAEFFKIFGDSTRIKVICALSKEELCVCDIANIVNNTQSAISHQLRILRQMKIVKCRKKGKIVYYSLDDEHVENILTIGMEHMH